MDKQTHFRVIEIAEILSLHRDVISYRIKVIGIIPTDKWFYDKYQIELIKDFERAPKTRFKIYESKINTTTA